MVNTTLMMINIKVVVVHEIMITKDSGGFKKMNVTFGTL